MLLRVSSFWQFLAKMRATRRQSHRRLSFECCEPRLPLCIPSGSSGVVVQPDTSGLIGASDVSVNSDSCTNDADVESDLTSFLVMLDGNVPQRLQITDTSTGEQVFDGETSQQKFDASFLPPGDYLLRHTAPSGITRSRSLLVDLTGVDTRTTSLLLEGALPRRVRIREEGSGQSVWDNWVHGSMLDVVGMFPVGDYRIQHAASGENWQTGKLRIGANVPSYRVYAEVRSDQTLLVDWGNLGSHPSAHIHVAQQDTLIVDQDENGSQLRLTVPPGVITVEIAVPGQPAHVLSVGTPVPSTSKITLSGQLPRRVQIIDTMNGQMVFDHELLQSEVDLSWLSSGDYLLRHASTGESIRTLAVSKDSSGVRTSSSSLTLEGALPRRVRIIDESSGNTIWDNWIYASTLDVVGLFPVGDYKVQHAASGENWQTGKLRIGANVPSYRLYAEVKSDQTLLMDWGNLGSHSTAHVRVAQQDTLIVDQDENGSQLRLTVPPEVITVEIAVPGQPAQVLSVGTPIPSTSKITLSGTLPRRVQIIDTMNGQMVFDHELLQSEVDLSFLPKGNYLLRHASTGESIRILAVSKDSSGVRTSSLSLTLEGALPRRVRIIDESSGNTIWDNWIYGSTLDVVGTFPVGNYKVQHAASGENWQAGKLTIGANLPSYRLYVEAHSDQTLLIDWGPLGSHATLHTRVTQDDTVIVDLDESASQLRTNVPIGEITVEVMLPGQSAVTIELGNPSVGQETLSEAPVSIDSQHVSLSGNLPRRVRIIETSAGVVVFEGETTQKVFDLGFLPHGDYLLQHAGVGESYRSMSASIGDTSILQGETSLSLDGQMPRRLRIMDATTMQEVFDHWIYRSQVHIVDLLPEGNYIIHHAASGENWRVGELRVGASVPSYRLYFERLEGDLVHVNWGFVGYHANVRLRGVLRDDVFYDSAVAGEETILSAPAGSIDFQVILAPVLAAPAVDRTVTLTGSLPRHVRVFDPATGQTALELDQTTSVLDLTSLALGNYIVEHAALGEVPRYLAVANSLTSIETFDPVLEFEGPLPRRVVITDIRTQEVVWDYWIYGPNLNVLGLLPPGEYVVKHAASGEPWRKGKLIIGAPLPSYRLYTEQVSPQSIKINWSPLGSESSARIQILEDAIPILDITHEESEVVIDVPQGDLTVRVTVGPDYVQSLQHCSLPTLAQDGSCRSFSKSLYFSLVSDAMLGFTVPGSLAEPLASASEVILVEEPQHGTLQPGDGIQFQTYKPNPGFVGQDSAVLRVVETDGSQRSVLVTFNVAAPSDPVFAHFVPEIGTTQADYRTPSPSQLIGPGLPYALIVNSDFGKVVERINVDGSTAWRHVQESPTGAIAVLDNDVVVAGAHEIRILDADTGVLKRTVHVDLAATDVLQFANPLDAQRMLVSWFTNTDISYVGIWNTQQGWEWISQQTFMWPRWADLHGDLVVVADTYGHRIVGESISTGSNVFQIPAYFPNDVRFIDEFHVLITEEHADRVWIYDWLTEDRTLVISAPGPRSDLRLPFDVVLSLSNSPQLRVDPSSRLSLSKASTEFSGINTVYAPNGAVHLPDGTFYIADTDNHRVIHVSADGNVLAELVGLNNPTKVAYVLAAP